MGNKIWITSAIWILMCSSATRGTDWSAPPKDANEADFRVALQKLYDDPTAADASDTMKTITHFVSVSMNSGAIKLDMTKTPDGYMQSEKKDVIKKLLMAAYIGGNALGQVNSKTKKSDDASGMLAMMRVYLKFKEKQPGYSIPEMEPLFTDAKYAGKQAPDPNYIPPADAKPGEPPPPPKKVVTVDEFKAAYDLYMKDPVADAAKPAIDTILGFIDSTDKAKVVLEPKLLPFKDTPPDKDKYAKILVAAYAAGDAKFQVDCAKVADTPVEGMKTVIAVYKMITKKDMRYKNDFIDEAVKKDRAKKLQEFVDEKMKGK